jgi:hypothetical protein
MATMIIRVMKHMDNMCITKGNAFGDGVIAKGLDLMICKGNIWLRRGTNKRLLAKMLQIL